MNRYLLLFLLLSSGCLTACLTPRAWKGQTQMACWTESVMPLPERERVVYKTQMKVMGRSFGGLLFLADVDSVCKVSFVSELGMNFFDMRMTDTSYEVLSCFEPMHREQFLEAVVRKMRLLIENPQDFAPCRLSFAQSDTIYTLRDRNLWYRSYHVTGGQVDKITGYNDKGRMRICVTIDKYSAAGWPEEIHTEEKQMRFEMHMRQVDW